MLLFETIMSVITMYLSVYCLDKSKFYNKTKFLIYIILTIFLCYLTSLINRNLTLVTYIVLAMFCLYRYNKNIMRTIFVVGMSVIINMVAIYLCSYLMYMIWPNSLQSTSNIIIGILYLVILGMVFLFSKVIVILINIKEIDFTQRNFYLKCIITIIAILLAVFIYSVISESEEVSSTVLATYSIFIVSIAIASIIMIVMSIKSSYKYKELQLKNLELTNLQAYISNTESYYNEMRKFKHDYINIISTLAGFIESNDMKSLEGYFQNHIVKLSNEFHNDGEKLESLKKIKIVELRGLLTVKLSQAQQRKIDVSVEVVEVIENINLSIIHLSRVMGILLDNAIEAVEEIDNKFISLALFKKDNSIVIIIANSFKGEPISLQQIYKKGFSSKGEGRGMGLSILKEITDSNEGVSIETIIDNNIFTQILKINNK